LDRRGGLGVLAFGGVERPLSLVDFPLPPFTLLKRRRRLPRTFSLALLLLLLIGESAFLSAVLSTGREETFFGFWICGLRPAFFGFPSPSPRSVGSSVCSPNGPLEPTGRRRTTPGFAKVAAMMCRSLLSLAAPWWKRLLSAPHASKAAFIDGAAIAKSKKPSEVW
jgi:hypothetical protein